MTSAPGQSPYLLLQVIKVLEQQQIPYAVIGAIAAAYFGVVRASLDADVVISLAHQEDSLGSLVTALNSQSVSVSVRHGDASDPLLGVIVVSDPYDNRVDLILGIRGMDLEAFSRISIASFLDSKINMIGLEDFIAMKVFAGGPKDLEDAHGALEISKPSLNVALLKKLAALYGKDELATVEKLLKEAAS